MLGVDEEEGQAGKLVSLRESALVYREERYHPFLDGLPVLGTDVRRIPVGGAQIQRESTRTTAASI